jgi:hypothetical protein
VIAALTTQRFLVFRATVFLGRNSGQLLRDIELAKVESVDSKTAYHLFCIPNVRTRIAGADGQVVEIVSSTKDAKKARSFAQELTARAEVTEQDTVEPSP